jgi:hypothetical protein
MSHRTAAWLAWIMWTLSLPLITLSGLLGFLGTSARNQPGSLVVLFAVLVLTFPTVGALIASRRPENPIGWILCTGGLALGFTLLASAYVEYALFVSPGSLPGVEYAAWVSDWVGIPALFLMVAYLFLLFPDGRLPSPRWRPVMWAVIIGSTMSALGRAFGPGRLRATLPSTTRSRLGTQ